jgi:hypothetical protein
MGQLRVTLPKYAGRWIAALIAVAWVTLFVMHPVEAIWLIAIAFFLVTIWNLAREKPPAPVRGKDRTFRRPPRA